MRKRALRLWAGFAILVVGCGGLFLWLGRNGAEDLIPEPNQDMLPTLLEGCKNAVSSIRSGKGEVTVRERFRREEGGILETEESYSVSFSGERFRVSVSTRMIQNSFGTSLPADLGPVAPGTIRKMETCYDGERLTTLNVDTGRANVGQKEWQDEGLQHYTNVQVPGRTTLVEVDGWLPTFLGHRVGAPVILGREVLNGEECVVIEVKDELIEGNEGGAVHTCPRYSVWFWVNPSKAFTVPRIREWIQGGAYKQKTLIMEVNSEVREYASGVWGPERITLVQYKINSQTGEYGKYLEIVTTYAPDFQLNVPVTDGELSLVLPSGTKVYNKLLDEWSVAP